MNIRNLILGLNIFLLISISVKAQIPNGYYDTAKDLNGDSLKQALYTIIKNHTKRSYSNLWTDFITTDQKGNGKVWDMYSDVPGGTPSYEYTFVSNQCGNYSGEGSCYNREHSFPKSWWGGSSDTMYTDLFHLVPSDGYVNGKRGNFPYGEVDSNAYWTSTNGSKLGSCSFPGYKSTVFEPIDEYKGDFARGYFYMATRYKNKIKNWSYNSAMLDNEDFSEWALNLLYKWHLEDSVSQKEIDRNNNIYGIQHNRNPFIDHPKWVDSIWFPYVPPIDTTFIKNTANKIGFNLYPNPTSNNIYLNISNTINNNWNVTISNIQGVNIYTKRLHGNSGQLKVEHLSKGIYILQISNDSKTILKKIKWIKQ